jgi:WD40 repeat protein
MAAIRSFSEIHVKNNTMNKFIPILVGLSLSLPLCGQTLETVIQKGHELAVIAIAVSPDTNFVATGSKDKSLKLWDINSGREIRSFLHDLSVTSIDFSSDAKYILSGSNDKTVRMYEVESGKEVFFYQTEDYITGVAFDPQRKFFVAAGFNRTGEQDYANIFDYRTKQVIKRIPVDPDENRITGVNVAVSADGKWIGFGEDNRQVNIYKTETWEKAFNFNYEEGWCGGCMTMLTFHPDSKSVYMGSLKGPLKKYDLKSGELVKTYEKTSDDLTGLAISWDGKKLARAIEKNITIWDEASGNIISTLDASEKAYFHTIAFARNNKKLMVTSDDNTAFAWNYTTRTKDLVLTGFLNERDKGGLNYDPNFHWTSAMAKYVRLKNNLLISNNGKTLIKGKFGTKVKQWDISTGKAVMEFVGHKKGVLCYDLSKDGKKLLTGGGEGHIILWDLLTGDSLKVIKTYKEPIFDVEFNSDESQVASTSWDATMKIHDLSSGKLLTYVEFESYAAYNMRIHPSDLYLVTARLDNSLQLWEIDTRSVVRNFVGHTDVVSSLQFSTDQKTLMTSSWDGSIRLWDVGTGLMTKKFKGHRGPVLYALFSPDGKTVYSAGADRTIRIWDTLTGKVTRTLEGHNAEVTSLLFSPDGKMLISHGVDGVTKFWDLASSKEFFEHIHIGESDWMVKNPEGYFNGTDNARKYIHFVSGVKTYSVDQFFNDFYRPDLLPRIFQNRGATNDLKGIQGKLSNSPPPSVKVAVLPAGPGKAELYIRMIDMGAGVQNLKLFHNGKSIVLKPENLAFPTGKGQQVTYKHPIDLVGGTNTFTVSASNKDRIESDPHAAEIFSEHASKSSTCHILAVGINQYKNQRMSLNYAKPDAESFGQLMDAKGSSLFKSIQLHTLYDEQATREKILKKLDELSGQIHPEDVFIFYYAGHGSMVDNQFYFIPTETLRLYDAATLNKEGIEAVVLQEKFSHIKALKQLIIMDACQSGGSVELLATRGASEEKAIAQLSRSAGIHVMASAGSEQFATEFAELGHGLFTYVLIRALQGEADGAPKDGKVTIYELKSFIDDQVPEMTRKLKGKPQYPYTFSRGQDFPVVIE